jgi:hypothetical protein
MDHVRATQRDQLPVTQGVREWDARHKARRTAARVMRRNACHQTALKKQDICASQQDSSN